MEEERNDICREDREECLEALYRLEREGRESPVLASLLSEPDLAGSPVADVVMDLALDGEVVISGDTVGLTPKGRDLGRRIYGRHQLAERLLRSFGLREGRLHEEACRLEHMLSDEEAASLARRLDRFEAMLGRGVMRLRDVEPGEYVVVHLAGGRLQKRRLEDMGLGQGSRLRVARSQGRGPVEVESHGARVALGRGVAAKILVAPHLECIPPEATPGAPQPSGDEEPAE